MTPRTRTHRHGFSEKAPYWVLSSECVVVVVGNYKFAISFTRKMHLGMHLRFCNPRRNLVAPCGLEVRQYREHEVQCQSARPFNRTCVGELTASPSRRAYRRTMAGKAAAAGARGLPCADAQRTFISRGLSRCHSRSFSVARLSCCFLPRARPTSTLARPLFQNIDRAMSV